MMNNDITYWRGVSEFTRRMEEMELTASEKFLMHTLKSVQGKVIEARLNKPFQEWDFDDMLNCFPREGIRD